jgi:hypothetical protein
LACWFWRRFKKKLVYFYFLAIISPWRRTDYSPLFEEILNPFPQGKFVPSLVKTDPIVLEKK